MRVLVAGSTGLIGSAVMAALEDAGHRADRLVRPDTNADGIHWDPRVGHLPAQALDGVDAVINLAGRGIGARRWSDGEKRLLWESRVGPTSLLAEAIAAAGRPIRFLNASATGYYGDGGERVLDETAAKGTGFLAGLTAAWEEATAPAAEAGASVALLRTGIVLSAGGGALGRLLAPLGPRWLSPYRWGVAGPVMGRRWWSWITLGDEVRAILHLLQSGVTGPVNLVAPEAVTHRRFIRELGKALRRPAVVPIPRWVVKLALGPELARALVLDGQRVTPSRLAADGFTWGDTDLPAALHGALGR